MSSRTAVVLGASGLVGSEVLRLLVADPQTASVLVPSRRALGVGKGKVVERVVDFEHPESLRAELAVDELYCCLGTTIKKAGSQEAFRKVDLEYPVSWATEAARAGTRRALVISAVGADPKSSIFYNRVKGELDQTLQAIPFAEGVKIMHPSMLLGERTERRSGEWVVQKVFGALAPLFIGGLSRYRGIEAAAVAWALFNAARREPTGNRVYEGASLFALARAT